MSETSPTSKTQKLDLQGFKEKIFDYEVNESWAYKGTKPAIIDFYADWCGPCQMLSPILEEIATENEGKLDIFKVNTDQSPDLSAMFGVKGIPAMLFIPVEGEPEMTSGFIPKDEIENIMKDVFKLTP